MAGPGGPRDFGETLDISNQSSCLQISVSLSILPTIVEAVSSGSSVRQPSGPTAVHTAGRSCKRVKGTVTDQAVRCVLS